MHEKAEGEDIDLLNDKGTVFKVELLDPSKLEPDKSGVPPSINQTEQKMKESVPTERHDE